MSKVTTAYRAIVSRFEELYPHKTRLHNPYSLESNPDICKKDGWGLKVLDAENFVNEFCTLSIKRTFTIVVVKNFITLSSKEDGFDAVTLSILEDQQLACAKLFSKEELGVENDVDMIEITSISGVNELVSDEKKYLFSEVTFTILISEAVI